MTLNTGHIASVLLTIGFGVVLSGPPALAEELPEDWIIERVQWSVDLGSATTVQVLNAFGDLRVRPSDDSKVYVSAVVQRHADDRRRAEVGRQSTGSVLEIEVGFQPAQPQGGVGEAPESWERRRVDLTLFLPIVAELMATTEKGLVEVKGVEEPVELRSRSGDIVLSTSGSCRVHTGQGKIEALLQGTDWSASTHLETVTGPIVVLLPAESDVAVEMMTRGQLTTDFTLEVTHDAEGDLKTGSARLGGGKAELFLKSAQGNLTLRRWRR